MVSVGKVCVDWIDYCSTLFIVKPTSLSTSTQPTMKQSLVIFALLLSASFAHGQSVGLGIGSGGLVVKSNPNNDWRFAGRLNLQLYSEASIVIPSVMVVRQVVQEERAKFYLGGELGVQFITEADDTPFVVRTPIGVEYFPFENTPISATVEGGLNLFLEPENTIFYLSSLVEVAYYFGR